MNRLTLLIALGVILCFANGSRGAVFVYNVTSGSSLNLPGYSDDHWVFVPTPFALTRINISAISGYSAATIVRGYPQPTVPGGAPTALSQGVTTTFLVYDTPGNTMGHYVKISSPVTVRINFEEVPSSIVPFDAYFPGTFLTFNMSVTTSSILTPVVQYTGVRPADHVHVAQYSYEYEAAMRSTVPAGSVVLEYPYSAGTRMYANAYVGNAQRQATITAYAPEYPVEWPLDRVFNVTVKFNRPILAYVRYAGFDPAQIPNVTVSANIFTPTPGDIVALNYGSKQWPSYDANGGYRISTAATFSIPPCQIDYVNKTTYFALVFVSSSRYRFSSAADGSLEAIVSLRFSAAPYVPQALSSNATAMSLTKLSNIFSFGDLSSAVTGSGVISTSKWIRYDTTRYFSTTSLASCPAPILGTSFLACEVASKASPTVSFEVEGPVSFSYTWSSPSLLSSAFSQSVFLASDTEQWWRFGAALTYPFLVSITPASSNSFFARTFSGNIVGCPGRGSDNWFQSTKTALIPVLCPGDLLGMKMNVGSSGFVSFSQGRIGSRSTLNATSLALGGVVSTLVNMVAGDTRFIDIILPPGTFATLTMDPSEYFFYQLNPCTAQAVDIPLAVIALSRFNSTLPSSGRLFMRTATKTITNGLVQVTIAGQTGCQSNVSLPTMCNGFVPAEMDVLAYIQKQVDIMNDLNFKNGSIVGVFQSDYASNSTCYRAAMTFSCRAALPLCSGGSLIPTETWCYKRCVESLADLGCVGYVADKFCLQYSPCQTKLDDAFPPPPSIPPPMRPPVNPPVAPPVAPAPVALVPVVPSPVAPSPVAPPPVRPPTAPSPVAPTPVAPSPVAPSPIASPPIRTPTAPSPVAPSPSSPTPASVPVVAPAVAPSGDPPASPTPSEIPSAAPSVSTAPTDPAPFSVTSEPVSAPSAQVEPPVAVPVGSATPSTTTSPVVVQEPRSTSNPPKDGSLAPTSTNVSGASRSVLNFLLLLGIVLVVSAT